MKTGSARHIIWIGAFVFLMAGCAENSVKNDAEGQSGGNSKVEPPTPLAGEPYMGLTPTQAPQMLAPGTISTALTEYNGTFSPDGKELFYTSEAGGKGHIIRTYLDSENVWTAPEIAHFSGKYSEYDPLFSPDGARLYFSSERPTDTSSTSGTTNIWFVERTESGWGTPQQLPLSGKGDYYSSTTQSGDIYYNIWNTGKILKASRTDTGYESEELPALINSRSDVGDPFVSPKGDYLIYRAYYNEGFGRGDLYISFNVEGEWSAPQNLGEPINSKGHEICPAVTSDGKMFIFASDRLAEPYTQTSLTALQEKHQSTDNGNLNIYYMSAAFIEKMRPDNMGADSTKKDLPLTMRSRSGLEHAPQIS